MANKVYINPEASRTWSDATTPSNELLDLGGLGSNDVSGMGSYWDLNQGAGDERSEWYEWVLYIAGFDSAPAITGNRSVDLYIAQSNATTSGWDGEPDINPGDATEGTLDGTAGDRRATLGNLLYVGSVIVRTTTASDTMRRRGIVRLTSRYVSPVVHNNASAALLSSADDHMITLTPIPPEMQ